MDKVLPIDRLRRRKQEKQRDETFQERLEAVRRLLRCSACPLRCAMCGQYRSHRDKRELFPLCEGCLGEWEAYQQQARSGDMPPSRWHNPEWKALWTSWVEFRKAIEKFRNSPEAKEFLEEPEG